MGRESLPRRRVPVFVVSQICMARARTVTQTTHALPAPCLHGCAHLTSPSSLELHRSAVQPALAQQAPCSRHTLCHTLTRKSLLLQQSASSQPGGNANWPLAERAAAKDGVKYAPAAEQCPQPLRQAGCMEGPATEGGRARHTGGGTCRAADTQQRQTQAPRMDLYANHVAIDLIGGMTWGGGARQWRLLRLSASFPVFLQVHTPCPCHPSPLVCQSASPISSGLDGFGRCSA